MALPRNMEQTITSSPSKIKILHIDHAPVIGGAELSLLELLETLNAARYTQGVVCSSACPAFLEMLRGTQAQVFIGRLPRMRGVGSVLAVANAVQELCNFIREFKPDILHSNTVRAHIASAVAGRLCGVKVLWTIRDFTFPIWVYRPLVHIVDYVICVSNSISKVYGVGPAEAKSKVIPNGILPPRANGETHRKRIRTELGIPDDVPVAASVGQLLEWKGQDKFLEAARLVKQRLENARFLVVGDGPSEDYKRKLEKLAQEPPLAGSVTFTGYQREAVSFMCASDVVVHTSLEPEAFGRVIIEAMAVGCPVIASPYGGPTEIIENGVNGLLVPPEDTNALADAMCTVLTNGIVAEQLSSGGRRKFEQSFHQQVETEAVQHVYEWLIDGKLGEP